MGAEIVKVQVPLSHEPDHVLVYGQGHKHMREQPLTPDLVAALDREPKGYFKAEWDEATGWAIGARVAAQQW